MDFDNEGFREWLRDRPDVVKKLAELRPPDRYYTYDGDKVIVRGYQENGNVIISREYDPNTLILDVRPDELTQKT